MTKSNLKRVAVRLNENSAFQPEMPMSICYSSAVRNCKTVVVIIIVIDKSHTRQLTAAVNRTTSKRNFSISSRRAGLVLCPFFNETSRVPLCDVRRRRSRIRWLFETNVASRSPPGHSKAGRTVA